MKKVCWKILFTALLFCYLPVLAAIEPFVANGALDQAGIPKDQLLKWSSDTLTTLYTYDFQNVTQTMQNSRSYFTKKGYDEYQTALQISQWLPIIQRKKYDVLPILNDSPTLLSEGVTDNVYTWSVQIPLVLYLRGPYDMSKQAKTVVIKIKRTTLADSPSGLLIDAFEFKSKE